MQNSWWYIHLSNRSACEFWISRSSTYWYFKISKWEVETTWPQTRSIHFDFRKCWTFLVRIWNFPKFPKIHLRTYIEQTGTDQAFTLPIRRVFECTNLFWTCHSRGNLVDGLPLAIHSRCCCRAIGVLLMVCGCYVVVMLMLFCWCCAVALWWCCGSTTIRWLLFISAVVPCLLLPYCKYSVVVILLLCCFLVAILMLIFGYVVLDICCKCYNTIY